jgi:hypothetical protein
MPLHEVARELRELAAWAEETQHEIARDEGDLRADLRAQAAALRALVDTLHPSGQPAP